MLGGGDGERNGGSVDVVVGPLAAVLDGILREDFDAIVCDELIAEVETQARRLDAVRVELAGSARRTGTHRAAGQTSLSAYLRATAGVSNAEARERTQSAAAMEVLPLVRRAFRAGQIGLSHMAAIARGHANPRIGEQFEAFDAHLAAQAKDLAPNDFRSEVQALTRLLDVDGTLKATERANRSRYASLLQDFDGGWTLQASFGPWQGAVFNDVLEAKVEELFDLDWAAAKAAHGRGEAGPPDVNSLWRTPARRRADALFELVTASVNGGAGPNVVINFLIDETTFTETLEDIFGPSTSPSQAGNYSTGHPTSGSGRRGRRWEPPTPPLKDDPHSDLANTPLTRNKRCATLDGAVLDPHEVALQALHGHVRRAVIDGSGVTIDLGRRQRLFRGNARDAALLSAASAGRHSCAWPGCAVPLSRCDIDHVTEHHRDGGETDQANASPLCNHHNRHKHSVGIPDPPDHSEPVVERDPRVTEEKQRYISQRWPSEPRRDKAWA